MARVNLEEAFKKAGWTEITRLKEERTCHCGGEIAMFWGTVLKEEGFRPVHHQLFGPDPKPREKIKETVGHGPVCEECGLLYSPYIFRAKSEDKKNGGYHKDGMPD